MNTTALMMLLVTSNPALNTAITSKRTLWYSGDPGYQVGSFVERADDSASYNPNTKDPWRLSGGISPKLKLAKRGFLYLPKGKKIVLWNDSGLIKWKYPVGAIVGEVLSEPNKEPFEIRVRMRLRDDWDTAIYRKDITSGVYTENHFDGPVPKGYNLPIDCRRCHEDAGLTTKNRNWKGVIRGSDGIFSVPILEIPDRGFRKEPALNKKIEHMVRFRRDGEVLDNLATRTNLKKD